MKKLFWLLALPLMVLASCTENIHEVDTEYQNWQQRNTDFFREKMAVAKAAIATARAQYGDDWEAHCNYRIYRSFSVTDDTAPELVDSVCVEVVERGTGSGNPQYTDSVDVNYLRRLMPTEKYPEGRIFAHSGYTVNPEDIFSAENAPTVGRHVGTIIVLATANGFTAGEATALQHMRIGDRWRIYTPAALAFNKNETATVPAYSAIVSELRLCAYFHVGYQAARQQ